MNKLDLYPIRDEVSYVSANEYEKNIPIMIESVNSIMDSLNATENLIGDNPLSVMHENHKHHAKFMVNVFKLNDYQLLGNTIKWVLNSYISRGFKVEYFQKEIKIWMQVINKTLDSNSSSEIIKVYEWILSTLDHEENQNDNRINKIDYPFGPDWEADKNKFFNLLIKGDSREALSFSKSIVNSKESVDAFYTKIIKYTMYEIGLLWEEGLISVAQEHLATSIVMRIMSFLYMNFDFIQNSKGKAIVTASFNEYHEVGARMISDLLELDGWNVIYLGANIPNEEFMKIIHEEKPDFISISVTMSFNISNANKLISQIRSDPNLDNMKILLGGYAFTISDTTKNEIKADKIALNSQETIKTARLWWDGKNELKS